MKKNKIYFFSFIGVVVVILAWVFSDSGTSDVETVLVPVNSGEFVINVTTTGELEAKSSKKINGPDGLRNVRIHQLKIDDIIPDGTIVDSGQYVASLDRTELNNKVKDKELELEKFQSQYTKMQLDTTMELRNARNELINLKFSLEEKRIVLDQSKYEPPATQRQVQIDLEKTQRTYDQTVKNYQLKLQKANANMKEVGAALKKAEGELEILNGYMRQFTIYAPQAGMVIYVSGWDGQKKGVGSTISVWDNVVAKIPNLAEMIVKTYVNEIDISKVKKGQEVEIGVDAFPDKAFTGSITSVANIGQQMRNSNAKVFEVTIQVNEYDSIIRPGMTSKSTIITSVYDSVLYIPIECIQNNDSLSFVYCPKGKKQVILGKTNENEIIVRAGLDEGDEIYLVAPETAEEWRLYPLDTAVINNIRRQDSIEKTKKKITEKPEIDIEKIIQSGDMEAIKNIDPKELEKYMKNKAGKPGKGGGKKGGKPKK